MATHRIRKGLDLPLAGAPERRVHDARRASRVALLGADYTGLRPRLRVQSGDRVLRGQAVFEDSKNPGVAYTAPGTGTVIAVHRGERRAFQSLAIELDPAERDGGDAGQADFEAHKGKAPAALSAEDVRALLLESGLWTAFRTRPFSRVPAADAVPQSIFVIAMDTQPHAPDVELALEGREEDFALGVLAVERLTEGPVFVCRRAESRIEAPAGSRASVETFEGPHPAGTAGVAIHLLDPVHHGKSVWHVNYQDVAAIGHLVRTGVLDPTRVISISGPGAAKPRLLRTRIGVSLDELAAGELAAGEQRVISGSVLAGRKAMGEAEGYLGRYHLQVSVLPEGREREPFGWIAPGANKFSVANVVLGALAGARRRLALTTTTNGSARAMVPIGTYEKVMPMDIMPTFLLRALISGDTERAEALGALELDEEDLALCTFVCPGKYEYGPLLRETLARIEKEG